jgi:hypothetical protein
MLNFFNTLQTATEKDRESLFSAPIIQAALMGEIEKHQYVDFETHSASTDGVRIQIDR